MANKDILELVFKHSGGVELRAIVAGKDVDTVIWASDTDPDFMDEFGQELLEADTDTEAVLEYLVDMDVLDDDESADVRIFTESLDGRDIEADPGDEDDDEDDEDEFNEASAHG